MIMTHGQQYELRTLRRLATALGAVCFTLTLSFSAANGEDAAKAEAEAPVPDLGQTACTPTADADPAALLKELLANDKLTKVMEDANYVAIQDKSDSTMWTFTQKRQFAHPAVVCRTPVTRNDEIFLDMVVNCKGQTEACEQLEQDFRELNARMQLAIKNKTVPRN